MVTAATFTRIQDNLSRPHRRVSPETSAMSNLQFCEKCQRGYLAEQGHNCPVAPLLKIQVPEAPVLRLFQVQDWAYVAAYSPADAIAWHEREYGETDPDYCDEIDADKTTMRDGDPDDPNFVTAPVITMRAEMDRMLAGGEVPPFLVAVDGHYA
jgi:hypothetical protein